MTETEWLLVPISQKTKTATLDRYIEQALTAGYGDSDFSWRRLNNNRRRVDWLLEARVMYWRAAREMLQVDEVDPVQKGSVSTAPFAGIKASEADDFLATIPMPEGIKVPTKCMTLSDEGGPAMTPRDQDEIDTAVLAICDALPLRSDLAFLALLRATTNWYAAKTVFGTETSEIVSEAQAFGRRLPFEVLAAIGEEN